MKVIFMGTPDFAVGTLKALVEAGHEVAAVVTQPDKPKGRSKELVFSPVKQEAVKLGIEVLQPEKARNEEFIEKLRTYNADIFVVVAFGQLLPKSIIDMPRFGCVNVHASLLPEYRGASPIQWAVIDGCEYSGVTTMKMDEGLDTGDILLVKKVKLDKKETGGSLFDKLAEEGAALLIRTLPSIADGTAVYTKQPEESPTPYAAMISKKMGLMDFSKSDVELERLVRGLNPWPSAYTFLNGKTLKVWKCAVERAECGKEAPGTIIGVDKSGIHVACGSDTLILKEVQLEGKKRMETDAFLRGYQVTAGTMLKDHKE